MKALRIWEREGFAGEPFGWNRAATRDESGEMIHFRRRPDCDPKEEYITP